MIFSVDCGLPKVQMSISFILKSGSSLGTEKSGAWDLGEIYRNRRLFAGEKRGSLSFMVEENMREDAT